MKSVPLEFFLSVFSRIWTECGVSLRIQSKCGKIQTKTTPNTEILHTVVILLRSSILDDICQGPTCNPEFIKYKLKHYWSEPVVERCSVKKVFLKISQNSQKNTCARISFLIKLQSSALQLY